MARDDVFIVRHRTIPALSEANADRSIMNKFGAQIVVDFYTQLLLSGLCFHMQTGTEDDPITTNGPLDDTKPVMVADNNSGVMIPLLFEVNVAAHISSATIEAMLEQDMDKKRYVSGGQAFVPEQMNNAASGAAAANGTFFTIESADIVAAAKSAVPASIELARATFSENAIADPAGSFAGATRAVFSARDRMPTIAATPSSLCAHFGAAAGDHTGHAVLEFAQFSSDLAW